MDPKDIERLQQRVADLRKKMERVGLEKKEETVEQEDKGVAEVAASAGPLGSAQLHGTGTEWSHIPLRGLRSFRFEKPDTLTGIAYRLPWEPGENVAVCGHSEDAQSYIRSGNPFVALQRPMRRWTGMGYDAEHSLMDCTHGFYSLLAPGHHVSSPGYVDGMVEGWGQVVAGPDGFRCQKAKIVALVLPNADGALGTKEEEVQKAKAEKKKKKKKRDKDEPNWLIRWMSRHDGVNGVAFAVGVLALLWMGFGVHELWPWGVLLIPAMSLPAFLAYCAWAADFSLQWGIGSEYWRQNTFPPELLRYLDNRQSLDTKWANAVITKYGVPAYKSVEAMLERHPIERGEA